MNFWRKLMGKKKVSKESSESLRKEIVSLKKQLAETQEQLRWHKDRLRG